MKLKNKYWALLLFFFLNSNALAQNKTQILEPLLSSVRFKSNSIFQASGKFTSYSGQILVNPLSKKIEEIKLILNASKIKLDQTENPMQALTFAELIKTLPDPLLNFVSQKIIPLQDNLYRIVGQVIRGNQKWNVNFKIKLNQKNPKQTECIFKNETKVPQGTNEIPVGLDAIGGNLEFEGNLVFKDKS